MTGVSAARHVHPFHKLHFAMPLKLKLFEVFSCHRYWMNLVFDRS